MAEWTVSRPGKLTFDGEVTFLKVRIVDGAVNVVASDEGPARLEVAEVHGPELLVTHEGGTLTVGYREPSGKGLLGWLDRGSRQRRAVVSLAVPARTRLDVAVVSAATVVSGIEGATAVRGVNGDTTLVRVSGPVQATTVSGSVDAQAVAGDLRVHTVTGELTVVEGTGGRVRADSVSGAMVLDLDPQSDTDVKLNTVSGEVALRLAGSADAEVRADTASGTVASAFGELRLSSQWGARRLTGRLGEGRGTLKVTTVSGSVALLGRPESEDGGPAGDEGKVL